MAGHDASRPGGQGRRTAVRREMTKTREIAM
jgi:hypothetical protein